ncbi:MAG: DUF2461 domain-containing protein [Actinomycetota bacterium]
MQSFKGWPPAALAWFSELEQNNNREWFQANRQTYDEAVRGPLEALLAEVNEEFGDGKVFRPNRDTRFSADKTPYKLQIYAVLYHPGRGGWYVQLRKEGLFAGGGLYDPDRERLAAVRSAIAADDTGPKLEEVVTKMEAEGLELMKYGALKTAPRGYPADHPRVHLLRLPHLAAGIFHPAGDWLHTAEAKQRVVEAWRSVTPLLEWLAGTAGPTARTPGEL